METARRDEHQDDDAQPTPKHEEHDDGTQHTAEGDIATASASDADAGDLGDDEGAS